MLETTPAAAPTTYPPPPDAPVPPVLPDDEPFTVRTIQVDPRELLLLTRNARFMKHETYRRLVDNVKRDGGLTQTPFAAWDYAKQKYEVLSGNHRTKAAIDADLEIIDCQVTNDNLSTARKRAIQLAHNAIAGEDDAQTLKALYAEIGEIDMRVYTGLDDKSLKMLESVKVPTLQEARLDFQTLMLVFLPDELERARDAIATAGLIAKTANAAFLARMAEYDRLMDALDEVGGAYNIINSATALMVLLSVFEAHKTDLQAGYVSDPDNGEPTHHNWVPISSILGVTKIPPSVALVLRRAVEGMVEQGNVTEKARWQVLELWAADWLAGN